MSNKSTYLIFLIVCFCMLNVTQAAVVTFNGAGDGTSWEDPSNWDSGSVPTAADDVIITNSNAVTISTTVEANSLLISLTAQLTVNATGVLNMYMLTANGNMIQLNDTCSLTNNGAITAELASGSSIDLNNHSRVTNNGTMNLINPVQDPINLTNTSEFTNYGTIIGNDGADAIELGNSSKFYNHGDIYLENFSDEGVDLDSDTEFNNTGFLSVSNVSNDLICIDGIGDHFINSGIVQLINPGNAGIEVDDGKFTNELGGVIDISQGNDDGIVLESSGNFDNYGQINIQIAATSSADDGIDIQSSATFRNFNTINITMSGDGNANAIFLDASSSRFTNEECAVVNMLSQHRIEIDGGAILTNEGVLAAVYSGTHDNQGTITNNGVINAPNGFNISPNGVTGSGVVDLAGTVPVTAGPEITCPADITIGVGDDTSPSNTGTATATDNCDASPTIGFEDAEDFNDCAGQTGTITRTWTATDSQLNTASCDQTINIVDNDPPLAICQDITVELDATGNVSVTASQFDGGTTDDCLFTLSINVNSFTCLNVGPNLVILTATDPSNNSHACEATANVEDNELPLAICQDITVELDATGNVSITPGQIDGGTSDNCSFILSLNVSNFSCTDIGPNLVILTATDPSSNSHACEATVNIEDNEPPVAVCQDITVELDAAGNVSITPGQVDGGTTDNCSFALSLDINSFTCLNLGPNAVNLTATDPSNNSHSCPAIVTVEDNLPPTVTCMDATVELDANGEVSITHANFFAGSSDNCGFIGLYPLAQTDYTCADLGANPITLEVFDGNGNDNSCSATLTVEDNSAPILACKNIALSLNSDGNLTIAPADIFDGMNSSDNCGSINLVSVSPNQFTCLNEGANTVALVANDGNGNVANCTATVTISEFITNINVVPTDESCAGAGDGMISASATALGGQLKYSINGGNFQGSGLFVNLSPGAYTVTIKAFGIPAVCEETVTTIVGAGPTPITCYKDADSDGYTNGQTIVACSCPTGYVPVATAGDCNDSNADIYPGAPELCDGLDNDCDGVVPVVEQDNDGDGYAVCDGDCNDNNADIYPGATEICDGEDNDCDGDVDEGVSSGQTYTGNVTFMTQAQIDAWLACYAVINGNLTIVGNDISNLDPLSNLIEVTGSVSIYYNGVLTSLNGLDNLATVGGSLSIFYNFSLSDCCAIDDLLTNGGVAGAISIFFNAYGSHCNSAAEIMSACPLSQIQTNPGQNAFSSTEGSVLNGNKKISLFPNPASHDVTLMFNEVNTMVTLKVMDLFGRTMMTEELESGTNRVEIDLSNSQFISGIYLITLTENGETTSQQLVVQRR